MEEVNDVLKASGYKGLNPVQEKAVKKGFEKNLIVAAPTASGKTLIAEIAALKIVRGGKKVVYIVPLKALAQEKYQEFKRKYNPMGISVGLSIGDLDSADTWISRYDIIIATSEKLDSLLRHGISWAGEIGLVVADEIHLLNDPSRGPTLEMVLTRLTDYNPIILGLSATINNYKELASWLKAESLKSDYRPVKLFRGICYDSEVTFVPERKYSVSGNILEKLTSIKKQSLVFVSTRRGTEATAEKLGGAAMPGKERGELESMAKKIRSTLDNPTPQCERLARCVKQGTAFHHAGLTTKQRSLVEEGFRSGLIRLVCATPTLAAGLNLPAYRVIVRDLKRFSSFRGMDFVPVLEIQQMMGRGGRPEYDTEGEAILLPKNQREAEYSWKNYIHGEPEKITSKLGVEPVLRTHILALIAGGVCSTRKELVEFFEKTFYAFQYQDMVQLKRHLDKVLNLLEGFGFVSVSKSTGSDEPFKPAYIWEEDDSSLKATLIGRRVSELYIDPLTADFIIKCFSRLNEPTFFTILHMIANCNEMKPSLSLRKKDFESLEALLPEESLAVKAPNEWDLEYEDFLRSIKMASMLRGWASEKGEDYLLENFNVAPGELRARLDRADWMLYATQELGLLLGRKELLKDVRKTRLRVKYGIMEELLPFIKLKGVGRVRARRLYGSGIKSLATLRKTSQQQLARIVGPATADSIKKQL